jgi:hypothetical protein
MERRADGARRTATASTVFLSLLIVVSPRIHSPVDATNGALAAISARLQLDESDRRLLQAGGTVIDTLDVDDPSHIVVFAASGTDVGEEQFVERVTDAERFWRGPGIPVTGVFSRPARAADVARMSPRATTSPHSASAGQVPATSSSQNHRSGVCDSPSLATRRIGRPKSRRRYRRPSCRQSRRIDGRVSLDSTPSTITKRPPIRRLSSRVY